jgi:hypothetical protein
MKELAWQQCRQLPCPRSCRPAHASLRAAGVIAIAHDRVADRQEVDPDLVRAARLEPRFQKIGSTPPFQTVEVCDGGLAVRQYRDPFAIRGRAPDRGIHGYFVLCEMTPDHGRIGPSNRAPFEHRGETAVHVIIPRHEQEARGILVEPVHETGPGGAGLSRQSAEVVDQGVGERATGVSYSGMHDHSRRLVDNEQVFVLEDDSERYRFAQKIARLGRRDFDDNAVTSPGSVALARHETIHEDVPFLDQGSETRPR